MLKKLRRMRTNERALIAVDVLLHSKSAFMNIFLMTFLMRVSLSSSPVSFISYCIVRYTLMAIFSIVFLRIMKKHPVATWRVSMFFSIAQILAILFLDENAFYFTYVIALFSALESTLYWRPKMYFDITEISNERRLRFKAIGQIFIEITKVIMPVALGLMITESSYTEAGFVILAISVLQLILSMFFRPTAKPSKNLPHSYTKVYKLLTEHKSLRRVFIIQLIRGLLLSSAAYIIIAQINVYASSNSDLNLGIYTSAASVVAMVILLLYRKLKTRRAQETVLIMLAPPIVLLPLILILFPHEPLLSIVFYVFVQSVIESFFNNTILVARLQQLLKSHLHNESLHFEIEAMSEVALTMGRVVGQSILLALVITGNQEQMMWLALAESLLILPILKIALPSKNRL